jgi:hypothetical protein
MRCRGCGELHDFGSCAKVKRLEDLVEWMKTQDVEKMHLPEDLKKHLN